ncbi:MAG: hypothetical protein FJX64_11990, partial [Alphaproteobacteria bacterium]|nr:hypothetical protein [Alphaproteobacteria bacterium]
MMAFKSEQAHIDEIGNAADRVAAAEGLVRDKATPLALETARHIISEAGMRGGKVTENEMAMLVLRGWAELQRVTYERVAAFVPTNGYGGFRHDPLFAGISPMANVPSANQVASTPPGTMQTSTAPLVSVAMSEFVATRLGKKTWGSTSQRQNEATYKRFREWCGDRPVDLYRKADLADFADAYARLPPEHATAPHYRTLAFREILAEAEKRKAKRIIEKTVARNFGALSAFFRWCVKKDYCEKNPCTDAREPAKDDRPARDRQPPWTVDQLNALFRTPAWKGFGKKRYLPGDKVEKDWFYWLPLISLFAGTRLAEPAGLLLADI